MAVRKCLNRSNCKISAASSYHLHMKQQCLQIVEYPLNIAPLFCIKHVQITQFESKEVGMIVWPPLTAIFWLMSFLRTDDTENPIYSPNIFRYIVLFYIFIWFDAVKHSSISVRHLQQSEINE